MPSPDIPAIESRAAAATAELSRICRSGNDFRMSIPANPSRDSDLILAAALADGEALLARVRELEGEVAAKDGQLSKWIDEISAIRQLIRLRICPRNPDDDTSAQLKAAFTYADLISERQNERALKLERENGDLRRKLAKHGIEVPR